MPASFEHNRLALEPGKRGRGLRGVLLLIPLLLGACGVGSQVTLLYLYQANEDPAWRAGLELAVDEINARDGIAGHLVKLSAFETDPKSDSLKTRIEDLEPMAILFQDQTLGKRLVLDAETLKIPLLSLSHLRNEELKKSRWVFQNAISPREEALVIWQLIYHYSPQGVALHREDGDHPILEELRILERREKKRLLGRVRLHQAHLVLGSARYLLRVLPEIRESDPHAVIITTSQALDPTILTRQTLHPFLCPATSLETQNFGLAHRVADIYFSKYGEEIGLKAAIAYDSIMLISSVLGSSSPSQKNIYQALTQDSVFSSIFGTRYLPLGGRYFSPRMYPTIVQAGEINQLVFHLP